VWQVSQVFDRLAWLAGFLLRWHDEQPLVWLCAPAVIPHEPFLYEWQLSQPDVLPLVAWLDGYLPEWHEAQFAVMFVWYWSALTRLCVLKLSE
jgi:hypothetical protein